MYSTAELILLTRCYLAAHPEVAVSALGERAAGNEKLLSRLLDGMDCTARGALAASLWFDQHWPEDLRWPLDTAPRGMALRARAVEEQLRAHGQKTVTIGKRRYAA